MICLLSVIASTECDSKYEQLHCQKYSSRPTGVSVYSAAKHITIVSKSGNNNCYVSSCKKTHPLTKRNKKKILTGVSGSPADSRAAVGSPHRRENSMQCEAAICKIKLRRTMLGYTHTVWCEALVYMKAV